VAFNAISFGACADSCTTAAVILVEATSAPFVQDKTSSYRTAFAKITYPGLARAALNKAAATVWNFPAVKVSTDATFQFIEWFTAASPDDSAGNVSSITGKVVNSLRLIRKIRMNICVVVVTVLGNTRSVTISIVAVGYTTATNARICL
jgi:hypothetical protein